MSHDATMRIATARSFLFVPGDRADRFDKAMGAGADMVIVDLEDAVAPPAKIATRASVAVWLSAARPVVIRVNASDTAWFAEDLALAEHPGVAAIMLPKSIAGPVLRDLAHRHSVLALVESARGILDLDAIAATPGVVRLALGSIDLALDLDTTASDAAFDPFRLAMTVAARANGLPGPIDGITQEFQDATVVEADVRHARSLGMTGKLCIHPAQISPSHAALRPTAAELATAQPIVEADRNSQGRAVSLDGKMVDRPVVQRARLLIDGT